MVKEKIQQNEILQYKGFIYWECPICGTENGFCLREETNTIYCKACKGTAEITKELLPLYSICECGRRTRYMTNIERKMFDMDCHICGNPIAVKHNEHKKLYENIRN